MNRLKPIFVFLCGVAALVPTASAIHVCETLSLVRGWNAVYFESTPDAASCETFFADLPAVLNVGAYLPDAYDNTAQYDADGQPIVQPPVSYLSWQRGKNSFSTLKSLSGGICYLVYATNACSKTFYGVPAVPRFTWRAASTAEGFVNLAAPSLEANVTVKPATYFREGPPGAAAGVWWIAGNGDAPTLLLLGFRTNATLRAGQAYALTAERADDWPGVLALSPGSPLGDGVFFAAGETQASATLRNAGTTNHTFRLRVVPSEKGSDIDILPQLSRRVKKDILSSATWTNVVAGATWDVTLAPGASETLTFGLDLTGITDTNRIYGAVLVVEDLGNTHMRVRVPIEAVALAPSANRRVDAPSPIGLWAGQLSLQLVSQGDGTAPLKAGGEMKPSVLLHVDTYGAAKLLQRVSFAQDTNEVTRLFSSLEKAKVVSSAARRVSSFMLDTAHASVVPVDSAKTFGEKLTFAWTVDARADDNPFRHAWHPDHDGLNATYDGYAKNEVWSVTNTVTFSWKDASGKAYVEVTPEGTQQGLVDWKIEGLKTAPIYIRGAFAIQRVLANGQLED